MTPTGKILNTHSKLCHHMEHSFKCSFQLLAWSIFGFFLLFLSNEVELSTWLQCSTKYGYSTL